VIARLHPGPPVAEATDEQLLEWYAPPAGARPWVRFEFVSSADGAATVQGRSGPLGNAADRRVLHLLRRHADVLLVGAGTVRSEGYGGELVDAAGRAWRREHGMPARPVVAVVSGGLDLDPGSSFFARAPQRPLVFTTGAADAGRRRALQDVADVVLAGRDAIDPAALVASLAAMRYRVIHSEGGPALFGAFLAAGVVDELCLSVSPLLAGGDAPRIVRSGRLERPLPLRLRHVLAGGDLLLLRYTASAAGD